MDNAPTCWVVTDGRAGIENQALGLAEAIGRKSPLNIVRKPIAIRAPWRMAPRWIWGDPFQRLSRDASLLRPPFPDLWIGCGRLSVPFSIAVKKTQPNVFVVQLQNPRAPSGAFDLVVAPHHDGVSGENVFAICGSTHRVTIAQLATDKEALAPMIAALPHPRIAVLIGGDTKRKRIDAAGAERLLHALTRLLEGGAGLMISTSRRTPSLVKSAIAPLREHAAVFFHDGDAIDDRGNPYMGILGAADRIVVTEDSVNMLVEAAMTGAPIEIFPWKEGRSSRRNAKFARFHQDLIDRGVARRFDGELHQWSYAPFDESTRAADEVLRLWRKG